MWQESKILVMGGTGHLGAALIHVLVSEFQIKPQNIRVFYLSGSPAEALNDIPGLEFRAGDVLRADEVNHAMQDVDYVFYMVGSTTFDPRQKALQWQINVEGTRHLLEAVRQHPQVKKVVYTSTVNVLGVPREGVAGDEDSADPYTGIPKLHCFENREATLKFTEKSRLEGFRPEDIGIGYYDSKLAAQELVQDYIRHYNLPVVSVLPGTMFGPYDQLIGNGMYVLSLYQNKMPVVLRGGLPLAHVCDVARGHVLALQKAEPGSRYIMSGKPEDNRTLKDMCGIIAEVLREKFPGRRFRAPKLEIPTSWAYAAAGLSEFMDTMRNRPMVLSRDAIRAGSHCLFYSSDRAITDLQYEPRHTFRHAVQEMVDYYVAHGLMEQTGRYIDRR